MPDPEPWVAVEEVAKHLGIAKDTIYRWIEAKGLPAPPDKVLNKVAGERFHNHSPLDFEKLKGDPDNIDKYLVGYIQGFSRNARDILREDVA